MMKKTITLLFCALALGACSTADRIARVGSEPQMTPVTPQQVEMVKMPMPVQASSVRQPASLWQAGARAFFKDQRAGRVGDILTVLIRVDDKAELENTTTRGRTDTNDSGVTNVLGFETKLNKVLPNAVNPASLLNTNTELSNRGTGAIDRSEKINLRVAAVVTQVLPNGNLVIQGRQEIAVNFEKRNLNISGVIRPEDISSANAISYEQIAEARISYGGEGMVSDVQQPRIGNQLMDIILPF